MRALIDGDVLLHYGAWKATSLDDAIDQMDYHLNDWLDYTFCTEVNIALGAMDGHNYRFNLYPEYKQIPSRVQGRKDRAEWFFDFKKNLADRWYTSNADEIEADDLLGHWANQYTKDFVIISVDKDLDQLPGIHYNPRVKEGYEVSLYEADRFFLKQMLMGDAIDRIPGIAGLGPKKAQGIVDSIPENHLLAEKILYQYKETYGDDWENWFLSNGKMLWIQRYPKDWFTLNRFIKHYASI